MASSHPTHVLFICNDNAARSIMASSLLEHLGQGRFQAYSAGSRPTPDGQPDAPHMDLIITLCDDTAGETCPIWPGHPATAQWSYPDPRAESHRDDAGVFVHVLHAIRRHVDLLVNRPEERIERLVLEAEARQIGRAPS